MTWWTRAWIALACTYFMVWQEALMPAIFTWFATYLSLTQAQREDMKQGQ